MFLFTYSRGWCLFPQCCFHPSSKDRLEPMQQLGEFACLCSNYIIERSGNTDFNNANNISPVPSGVGAGHTDCIL